MFVFLDQRYKLEYIESCLSELYDFDKCYEMLKKLSDLIKRLFDQYVALHPLPPIVVMLVAYHQMLPPNHKVVVKRQLLQIVDLRINSY